MALTAEQLFEKSGAILKGHFLLTSGLHSPIYWEKFQVLQYPAYTQELCRMIADNFRDQGIQVVAGPTTGGIILAFEVARQLGVRGIFAEKKEGSSERAFRRGFSIAPGERVLLVDDILTTGGSIREVISAISSLKGKLVGIGVLVDRSEKAVDFGVPLFSCLRSVTVTYRPEECPLCAAGIPLVKRGGS
ncbi:MAG: orotate phosphoribosyltransferase [Chloroflexi bacterium]|jgi:orotate phosphoribosyltransferase|nr:orotate phosphoribosyltransferase [Chloroflexota bacterium]